MSTSVDRTEWTITSTCRICRAAWNMAPGMIGANGRQGDLRAPTGHRDETMQVWRAALACPTGSILAPRGLPVPEHVFPEQLCAESLPARLQRQRNRGRPSVLHPHQHRAECSDRRPAVRGKARRVLRGAGRPRSRAVDASRRRRGIGEIRRSASVRACGSTRTIARRRPRRRTSSPAMTSRSRFPGVTVIPIPGHTIGSVAFLIDERLFVGRFIELVDSTRRGLVDESVALLG